MGVFSGLGRAIGSAALGAQSGQIRGEAEGYRREQQTAASDYKKEILKYQKARLEASKQDPDHLTREMASKLYIEHNNNLHDQKWQSWWDKNPDLRKQYEAEAQDALDTATGRKDAKLFNPMRHGTVLDAFHGPLGNQTDEAGSGAGGGPVAAPEAAPTPAPAPAILSPSERAALEPNQFALLNVAQRMEGRRPFGLGAPPPVMPAPAPQAAPAPAPVEPPAADPNAEPDLGTIEHYRWLYRKKPSPIQGKREPNEEFRKRRAQDFKEWKEELAIDGTDPKVQAAIANGTILGARAAKAPQIVQAGLDKSAAGTAQANEAVRASKVITPVKVEVGKSTIKHQSNQDAQGAQRVGIAQGQLGVAKGNLAVNQGRLTEEKRYHDQLVARGKEAVGKTAKSAAERADQQIVSSSLRIYTATQRGVAGDDVGMFSDPRRMKAQKDMEAALERIERRRSGAAGPAATGGGAAPAAAGGGSTAKYDPGEVDFVRRHRAKGTIKALIEITRKKDPAAAHRMALINQSLPR